VDGFNQIGEFGYNELLARRLTTPGGSVAGGVAPEIFPVLNIQGDTPELAWLKGESLCGVGTTQAAGAGNTALLLTNPANSRGIITIEGFQVEPAAGGWIALVSAAELSGAIATNAGFRDSRAWGPTATVPVTRPFGVVTRDNAGGLSTIPAAMRSSLTTWVDFKAVLLPGRNFTLQLLTIATAMTNATIHWRERKAQPGELV